MVYGETGRFPIYINVYSRMISYWVKLLSGDGLEIVNVLYRFLYTQYCNKTFKNHWFECIKKKLNRYGLSYVSIIKII
jgi:hypothetical protein